MDNLTMWLAVALTGASAGALAADDKMKNMDMQMHLQMMDANKDGMISKDEFMNHNEMMWNSMQKNAAGMVDMKHMEMMQREMDMKHGAKPAAQHHMTKKETGAK